MKSCSLGIVMVLQSMVYTQSGTGKRKKKLMNPSALGIAIMILPINSMVCNELTQEGGGGRPQRFDFLLKIFHISDR